MDTHKLPDGEVKLLTREDVQLVYALMCDEELVAIGEMLATKMDVPVFGNTGIAMSEIVKRFKAAKGLNNDQTAYRCP